jgi:hypothetical protein
VWVPQAMILFCLVKRKADETAEKRPGHSLNHSPNCKLRDQINLGHQLHT